MFKIWAPGIPSMYRFKRYVGYFGRFWVIFDELSCIFITLSSICIRQRVWRSLRGCVIGWFLLRPRVTQTFKTLLNAAVQKASFWFSRKLTADFVFFHVCGYNQGVIGFVNLKPPASIRWLSTRTRTDRRHFIIIIIDNWGLGEIIHTSALFYLNRDQIFEKNW